MRVKYSKRFQKQFAKFNPKLRRQFQIRQQLWAVNPYNPVLGHHMLSGNYSGFHSINITGDIRALYEEIDGSYVIFEFIGTHSELYGK